MGRLLNPFVAPARQIAGTVLSPVRVLAYRAPASLSGAGEGFPYSPNQSPPGSPIALRPVAANGDVVDNAAGNGVANGAVNGVANGAAGGERPSVVGKVSGEEEAQVRTLSSFGANMERLLQAGFHRWGLFVARNPFLVLVAALAVSALLSLGLLKFTVTTNPVDLWVSHSSLARKHMNYFNSHFG